MTFSRWKTRVRDGRLGLPGLLAILLALPLLAFAQGTEASAPATLTQVCIPLPAAIAGPVTQWIVALFTGLASVSGLCGWLANTPLGNLSTPVGRAIHWFGANWGPVQKQIVAANPGLASLSQRPNGQ
jgi:hypothetical protein